MRHSGISYAQCCNFKRYVRCSIFLDMLSFITLKDTWYTEKNSDLQNNVMIYVRFYCYASVAFFLGMQNVIFLNDAQHPKKKCDIQHNIILNVTIFTVVLSAIVLKHSAYKVKCDTQHNFMLYISLYCYAECHIFSWYAECHCAYKEIVLRSAQCNAQCYFLLLC
jgi:hypothetical protein